MSRPATEDSPRGHVAALRLARESLHGRRSAKPLQGKASRLYPSGCRSGFDGPRGEPSASGLSCCLSSLGPPI